MEDDEDDVVAVEAMPSVEVLKQQFPAVAETMRNVRFALSIESLLTCSERIKNW